LKQCITLHKNPGGAAAKTGGASARSLSPKAGAATVTGDRGFYSMNQS